MNRAFLYTEWADGLLRTRDTMAGVKRLGDLVTTDYFEKNHDPEALSKLTSAQSSSEEK